MIFLKFGKITWTWRDLVAFEVKIWQSRQNLPLCMAPAGSSWNNLLFPSCPVTLRGPVFLGALNLVTPKLKQFGKSIYCAPSTVLIVGHDSVKEVASVTALVTLLGVRGQRQSAPALPGERGCSSGFRPDEHLLEGELCATHWERKGTWGMTSQEGTLHLQDPLSVPEALIGAWCLHFLNCCLLCCDLLPH